MSRVKVYVVPAVSAYKRCPHCGSKMVLRDGIYGLFHACTGFYCTYTKSARIY